MTEDALPPRLAGRYRVVRELGRGSTGRVLLARHDDASIVPDEGDPPAADAVALKVLERSELQRGFVESFHLLRRLAHPAFARAWELGREPCAGRLYQVLEWCRGAPLEPSALHDRRHLPDLAVALLRALDHLHRLGWVHGDVAPPNVLWTGEPDTSPKLLDLGAAGRAGSGGGRTSGVLAWTAPERLEGAPLEARSDLWSLGALLFGLIHGRHPFPDYPARPDAADGAPTRPEATRRDRLDPWLDRLLARSPNERFRSAAAALAALEERIGDARPLVPAAELAARVATLPFVDAGGRLALLEDRLRSAADAGRPLETRVHGPPGSGVSRLLAELGHRLASRGIPVLREQALAADPPGALLRRLVGRLAPDEPAPPSEAGGPALARRLLAAVRAADEPVAVLVDDLPRADAATCEAVRFLARTVQRAPERAGRLLLVAEDADGDVGLEPWSPESTRELLRALFPGRRVAARVAELLAERSRGLPALLAPQLRGLAEAGKLHVGAASVQLDGAPEEASSGALPGTVEDAAADALERLSPEARHEAAMLAHARAPAPLGLLGPGAEALRASGLAIAVSTGHGERLTLRSPAVSERARSLLEPMEAHRSWAERWAERAPDDDGARAEQLHHRLRAGVPEALREAEHALARLRADDAAILLAALAGQEHALSPDGALAAAEAARHATDRSRAARLFEQVAEAPDADEDTRARALVGLGRLRARQARHADAFEAFDRARRQLRTEAPDELRAALLAGHARSAALTGRLGEAEGSIREGLERAGPEAHEVRAALRYAEGLTHWHRGELDRARERLDEALAHAHRAPAEERGEQEGSIVTALGLVAHRRGDLAQADRRYREALELAEQRGDEAQVLTALQNLGVVLHEQGAWAEALDTYGEALDLAEALGQSGRIVQLAGNLGNLWCYLGDWEHARETLQRGLELARRESNRYMEGVLLRLLGEVALGEQAWERARRLLEDAIEAAAAAESAAEETQARLELGRLLFERQEQREARRVASEALEGARRAERPGLATRAMGLLGAAHAHDAHGEDEEAERWIGAALQRIDQLPNPDQRWPVHLEACRLARRRGEPEEAERHAAEVRRLLRELEDAVPTAFRPGFRRQRERLRAREEAALPPDGAATGHPEGSAAERGDEPWSRLLEVTERLSSERNVQRLLEYIMDSAVRLSGAERGFLLLRDDDRGGEEPGGAVGEPDPRTAGSGDEGRGEAEAPAGDGSGLSVRVARNLDQENIRRTQLKISHGIARRVVATGERELAVDAMEDDRYRDLLSVHDLQLRSVLCLPMSVRGRVLGAIYLDNRFRSAAFGDGDVRLMEAFADQAAIALDNARLMEEMEASQRELDRARREVEELNARLADELDRRTRELEDTHRALERQQEQLAASHRYDRIIGESEPLRRVFRTMDRVLDNDVPVLIQGESGTGKELVARAIHYNGARRDHPFVAVNCGAIPAELLESELFGHVRGAFTGASSDKKGLFESAHGGTLLLDELAELPLGMQVTLLRVLQSGEIQKVGATRQTRVDVRIMAATNRDLDEEVRTGRFREDLYYRLAVVPVRVPPLRERRDDIPLLVQHFLDRNRDAGVGGVTGISRAALTMLTRYAWPGNVRQLEMVLKNAALFAEHDTLQTKDFQSFPEITSPDRDRDARDGAPLSGRSLAEIEREAIVQTLRDTAGNKKQAAEQLGIDRRTLYNKLERYGIEVERELRVR